MVSWNGTARAPAKPAELPPVGSFDTFLAAASILGLPAVRGRALQLGLGSLDETRGLVERFRELVGVDPDALAVQRARRGAGPGGPRAFLVGDGPDGVDGPFDLILCDFRRIPAGRDPLRRMGSLLRLLSPGGLALFDLPRRRGLRRRPGTGSVAVSWPDLAREASQASARISWVDKGRRDGTVYCITRGS